MSNLRHIALMLFVGAAGQGGAQQITPARLSRPIEFWNPDWSPDGRSIVFESTLTGKYSIYTINADGTNLRRLTADTANNEQPRWSPDGKQIVFSSDRGGTGLDIHLMNADGSNQRRLTTMPGSGGWYQSTFSPDGQWVAFQGRPDNKEVRDRIFAVRTDGSGLKQLSDTSYGAEGPRWSADGATVEFLQVPYPKRLWAEMMPPDMEAAKKGARRVMVRRDGSGLTPVTASPPVMPQIDGASGMRRSPDGRRLAYQKSVDGWSGIYIADSAGHGERLLTGGPGAGPLGYLRTATLTARTDTIDTFESLRSGGSVTRGNGAFVITTSRQIAGRRWEFVDIWFDSTGRETARQSMRTARGSLATELEFTRALTDSASMSYTKDRSTGWVVPGGRPVQLFDGASSGERFGGAVVMAAVATSKPAIGAEFLATSGSLYGGDPLATRVDTVRVVRRDTLRAGAKPLPVVVLSRGPTVYWYDETAGAEVASRGNAGPEKYWWHIRRGVSPPAVR